MIDLSELRAKRKAYVTDKAEEIVNDMIDRKKTSTKISTCDAAYYGWDVELHDAMPQIATKLREMGLSVSYAVRWGVTDWLITVTI